MNPVLWLPVAVAGVAVALWLGPKWLTKPDDSDQDEPTEEVPRDAEGLGVVDANALGGFLGSAMPDLAPPDAGDELAEE